MNAIENTKNNIKKMIKEFDSDRKLIIFDDDNAIVLDTCYVNNNGEELENIEIYSISIYDNVIFGETNFGCINLEKQIKDEDDWYTLEDIIKDMF